MSGPKACVIGWPIEHSRSPLIHGHWLKTLGIEGSYDKQAVRPEDLAGFVIGMADAGLVGCNVTVPHKEAIMPLLDELTADARDIGAVNTVWRDAGKWIGGNTDMTGFLANLDAGAPGWDAGQDRTAVVLGAGGAARAVVAGLIAREFPRIVIANRTPERASALAQSFRGRGSGIETCGFDDLSGHLRDAVILVNATSLGMAGSDRLRIDLSRLPAGAVVNDLVYVPLETELLAHARARGLATVDGLGMLLHQAVPGFARWFGVTPSVDAQLRAHVLASL